MTNRLAASLSPYLRAHAENPVDWRPWGEEAFAEARRRDVPLLISIGYSTCHWCHVMARESFSDPVIAAAIDRDFVAVKVDREEHPDVDGAYMAAASAFTQNLGWPLTVFATPQGRAFFAGTYWPPEARPPLPAFGEVLDAVHEAWAVRRERAVESADAVTDALREAAAQQPVALPTAEELAQGAADIAGREDTLFGGFGGAPKFPVATTLGFLQTALIRRHAPEAAASAARALAAMAASELRDEDGGFFRYATRRNWTVPHYERMLTDNAQLLAVALRAGEEQVARGIAAFLLAVLQQPGGGFGSAQDSESSIDGQRNEGGYYRRAVADRTALQSPAVDGKVITGWNGLAIAALADAGARLGEVEWIGAAGRAAERVLAANRDEEGGLVRLSVAGRASDAVATEADLGLLADGLFALALATGEAAWAVQGRSILDDALNDDHAADPVLIAQDIAIAPDQTDGDLPAGPAALAGAALSAWRLGAGERYRTAAVDIVRRHGAGALRHPFGHGSLLAVAAGLIEPPRQVIVVDGAPALINAARATDADLIAAVTARQALAFEEAGFEVFAGRSARPGMAFDCLAFVCRLPTDDPGALRSDR
ncbi:thioredoxin domain-containing protein [Microbacterium sp. NPDC055903]